MSARTRPSGPWLVTSSPNPAAQLRLFCFAYAGGGASLFARWSKSLPSNVEVRAIQLPGREDRFGETPLSDLDTVVAALRDALAPHLNAPYAFFGHSLGALLAYELVRRFAAEGLPLPRRLVVSGKRAPHWPARGISISKLPDDEFIAEISRYDGTPDALLQHTEFMNCILPRLRADATLFDDYVFRAPGEVPCPITAFGGMSDEYVSVDEVLAWKDLTTDFESRIFEGKHFFINSHQSDVLRELSAVLRAVAQSTDASCR